MAFDLIPTIVQATITDSPNENYILQFLLCKVANHGCCSSQNCNAALMEWHMKDTTKEIKKNSELDDYNSKDCKRFW